MSIQHCPDEVLDMFFQLLPFQSPDKAPTTLLHTLLTCRRFCAIARRHLIRVICLESVERVNLFAAYLTQLTDAGAYGSALLPLEHLAACGNYVPWGSYYWPPESEAQRAAELILPFIISIAAPRIRSLTILGFDFQEAREVDGRYVDNIVEPSVRFPKLQWLVVLDQNIIRMYGGEISNIGYRFPQLTSLYVDLYWVDDDVFALHAFRELRLDMLISNRDPSLPFSLNLRVETITIDASPYQSFPESLFSRTRSMDQESMDQEWFESLHEFVKANLSSSESSVVVAKDIRVRPKLVWGAWGDIVQGGLGYWKKG